MMRSKSATVSSRPDLPTETVNKDVFSDKNEIKKSKSFILDDECRIENDERVLLARLCPML